MCVYMSLDTDTESLGLMEIETDIEVGIERAKIPNNLREGEGEFSLTLLFLNTRRFSIVACVYIMYVCMYVCMYVYIYIHIYIPLSLSLSRHAFFPHVFVSLN